jgi:hypothetical protein
MLHRRKGRSGSPSPTPPSSRPAPAPPPSPNPNCKVETGVKEINTTLCSAMFGLVLSDRALREWEASRAGQVLRPHPGAASPAWPAVLQPIHSHLSSYLKEDSGQKCSISFVFFRFFRRKLSRSAKNTLHPSIHPWHKTDPAN